MSACGKVKRGVVRCCRVLVWVMVAVLAVLSLPALIVLGATLWLMGTQLDEDGG